MTIDIERDDHGPPVQVREIDMRPALQRDVEICKRLADDPTMPGMVKIELQ